MKQIVHMHDFIKTSIFINSLRMEQQLLFSPSICLHFACVVVQTEQQGSSDCGFRQLLHFLQFGAQLV